MNKNMDENDIFLNNLVMNNNILKCCKKYNISKLITFSTYRLFTDIIHDNYNETHIHSSYNIENNAGYLFSKKV
jgi:nucleoside-diphosphate-sugar epimerase